MKTSYHIYTLILACFVSQFIFAQDMLNVNDFNFKSENYNTSYIADDSSSLNISTIVSAVNATDNNNKFHFLLYGNMGKLGLGLGAKVNSSFYQVFQTTTAEILLAKRVNVGKNNSLNFGINAGLGLTSLRENMINQYSDINDPVLLNDTYNKVAFMAGMGMNYNWHDKLDLGISLPVLAHSVNGVSPVFFTNLSYRQAIGDNFSIKPGVLIYGPDYTRPTYEGNFELAFKDVAWIKGGGRSTKRVLFGAGANINFIQIGYMYNMNVGNDMQDVYIGAHNINVSFHFLANKPFTKSANNQEVEAKEKEKGKAQ